MFGNVLWAALGHWRLKSILNATEINMWDSHTQQSWAAGSRFLTGNRFEEIHDNQIQQQQGARDRVRLEIKSSIVSTELKGGIFHADITLQKELTF